MDETRHRAAPDADPRRAAAPARRRRGKAERELAARLEKAELRVHLLTLHPHMICNALNAAAALIPVDGQRAERLVVRLGTLLRSLLESSDRLEVTLAEELQLLRVYLEIEAIRFPAVRVSITADPAALAALVPQLLLQPLVENAFRHGLRRNGSGRIEVTAAHHGRRLSVTVRDDGDGLRSTTATPAVRLGLGVTRSRLERMYGPLHRFFVRDDARGGVSASITIPYRLPTNDAGRKPVSEREAAPHRRAAGE